MTVEEIKNHMSELVTIEFCDNQLREVDDEYLEVWLEEGPPDGTDALDWLSEYHENLEDWVKLGLNLLEEREAETLEEEDE